MSSHAAFSAHRAYVPICASSLKTVPNCPGSAVKKDSIIGIMGISIDMSDPVGIRSTGPPDEAMHLVAIVEQKLSQIGTVQPSYASDHRSRFTIHALLAGGRLPTHN